MPYYREETPASSLHTDNGGGGNQTLRPPSSTKKVVYNLKLLPFNWATVALQYDRLALLDLLDRNSNLLSTISCVILSVIVGSTGLKLLSTNLFHDLPAFWFCLVIAASQYSLIRSVQPDSASPTHGHNSVIAYSRPVYFLISAFLLLLFDHLRQQQLQGVLFYGVYIFNNNWFLIARDIMYIIILSLPIIFLFGLLPQINTFLMYLLEQCEVHLFGGSASINLSCAIFSTLRSCINILVLYGFCYGAMTSQLGSNHILFSAFCGPLVSLGYHLSRQSSSPWTVWSLIKSKVLLDSDIEMNNEQDSEDDVSSNYMKHAVSERLQQDIIICPFITVLVFGIHCSGVFTVQYLELILRIMVVTLGFTLHYILPRLRDNYPWLIFSKPILKSEEYGKFEVTRAARLMWYERALLYAESIEKNLLNVLFVITEITRDSHEMVQLYGNFLGTLLIVLIASKLVRSGHNTPHTQYIIYLFAYLFVTYDARSINPGPLILSYFVFGILFVKLQGLYLKLHFWLVYIAPWQITWGSAFHAFAQPFSVPHSAFLTMHALLASVTEAPFSPLIGSAIFLSSYARPLKFWERNYKTKRIDHSNTRLVNQLDRANSDDNNLNSIFYEHLTYSLQKTLAGDITLGRWGNVYAGDCFILASDYLNALVHVIERSNGVITFQLRGLEFSGTYCQQREVEAISEGADSSEHCCCFTAAKFKGLLSFNAAFNMRCLAWQHYRQQRCYNVRCFRSQEDSHLLHYQGFGVLSCWS